VAPRAYWKGYLKLSLVSCPVALFPASTEREKISFHQINKKTGNRIRYRKVDAESGEEVNSADIVKGYEVGKGQYIEIEPEELEAIAIESKRTIKIDEFVPKKEIDELYLNSPYYLVPDGEVGQQAFAVIREAIRKEGMVALGRVVFTSREHVIALEPRGKGLLGVTLRYPYEVRKEDEYFDDIPDEKIPKDMLELASHIVETKAGHFEPEKFEDQYEDPVMNDLLGKQVDMTCDQATKTTGPILSKQVKAYAITTKSPLPSLPDLPTADEAGLKGFELAVWHGVFAPRGTPPAIVEKLSMALIGALKDPDLVKRFREISTEPMPADRATPEAAQRTLTSEIDRWAPIIKAAGEYAD